ncbi:MAG: arsenic resistance N-acetyltransferase ArsN2 [Gemmatimonadales bacterium]
MPASITPASAADLPAILDLLRAAQLPLDGLAEHVATTVTARENDRLVGCAAVELYGESALLRSVAVDEAVRGTGLGRALTAAALDLARARGARTAYLLTTTAGGYFPRFGFRVISRGEVDPAVQRSVEFTTACPASALVMKLDLRHQTSASMSEV